MVVTNNSGWELLGLGVGITEPETTVGPARARGRPRMHGVPCQDRKGAPRRSAGYKKPKRTTLLCLSALHKHKERHCARKRKSHRETKRASHGKWRCTRVRNESNFGARWFMEGEASLEARGSRRWLGDARRPSGTCRGMLVSERAHPHGGARYFSFEVVRVRTSSRRSEVASVRVVRAACGILTKMVGNVFC